MGVTKRAGRELGAGEICLILSQVETGVVVDEHGRPTVSGGASRFILTSVEEARHFGRDVVAQYPFVSYVIFDERYREVERFQDEQYVRELVSKGRELQRLKASGWVSRILRQLGLRR